jgi:hypothetical protein
VTLHWDEVEDWDVLVPCRPVWTAAPGFDAPLHTWSFRVTGEPLAEERRAAEAAEAERRAALEAWQAEEDAAVMRARQRFLATLPNRDLDWSNG